MTEQTATMTYLDDIGALVQIQDESTVSRTVLKAEGVRLVLFAFDEGQVLTEHTAAMPVLLQTVSGRFRITGGDDEAELRVGDVIHFDTRLPHSVTALEPSKLLLIMIDSRAKPLHDATGIAGRREG
ncbi:MAG: cupin domain-containing protein [Ruaniaceae bacterium]|nr:cupin domain-containing protein [Ruaniaceae bacterium]